MTLATAWGVQNHIIIRKAFTDGIEIFEGESLEETNLDEIIVSYSDHWAYNYQGERAPFEELHQLAQASGMNWCNHHFKNEHRTEENARPGFNMMVIDVDGGITLETVHELLRDYRFMTYTTKRHTPDEHRFRLLIPINYVLDLDTDDYREFANGVLDKRVLGRRRFEPEIEEVAQPRWNHHYNDGIL